jgi:proline-specific peptidase
MLRRLVKPIFVFKRSLSSMSSVKTSEGSLSFVHGGETFSTYYKIFGDLTNKTRTPLIALHGGPGLVCDYLVPLADLAEKASIPVILYDQIGNGKSTHLKEKPAEFWTIDLFIDELINLTKQLKIDDAFDLLGHSWGGVLATEFEVRRGPAGLRHLVLSDSLASGALWGAATMRLLQKFPKDVQEGMAGGMKNPSAFISALKVFQAAHVCTLKPVPAEVSYTLDCVFGEKGDPTVAGAPCVNFLHEFDQSTDHRSRIMKNWSIIDRLHEIRVPAFVINGRADQAQDDVVEPFFNNIPKAKWVTFEQSSHMPFWEERERYMNLVDKFLAL